MSNLEERKRVGDERYGEVGHMIYATLHAVWYSNEEAFLEDTQSMPWIRLTCSELGAVYLLEDGRYCAHGSSELVSRRADTETCRYRDVQIDLLSSERGRDAVS